MLVFVEAAAVVCFGLFLIVAVGALGAIGLVMSSGNGGKGLPAVGGVLGAIALVTLAVAAFLCSIAVMMPRKRWARWTVVVIQLLFALYVIGDTVYYLLAVPRQSVLTDLVVGGVSLAISLSVVALTLWPDVAMRQLRNRISA